MKILSSILLMMLSLASIPSAADDNTKSSAIKSSEISEDSLLNGVVYQYDDVRMVDPDGNSKYLFVARDILFAKVDIKNHRIELWGNNSPSINDVCKLTHHGRLESALRIRLRVIEKDRDEFMSIIVPAKAAQIYSSSLSTGDTPKIIIQLKESDHQQILIDPDNELTNYRATLRAEATKSTKVERFLNHLQLFQFEGKFRMARGMFNKIIEHELNSFEFKRLKELFQFFTEEEFPSTSFEEATSEVAHPQPEVCIEEKKPIERKFSIPVNNGIFFGAGG